MGRENLSTPAYWDETNRKHLEGTSLEDRIDDLDQLMEIELEKLFRPFFKETALKLNNPELLTIDLFKKFHSFSLSYCWVDESAELFLVPLSDLLSYTMSEENANVEIEYGETSIKVVAKEDIAAKEKLRNFVESGTAEFIWKWGVVEHFPTEECSKGSPYDIVQIEPELVFEMCSEKGDMEDEPLTEDKLNLLQEIGLLLDGFAIGKDAELPNELLLCVKVLFMDPEEFFLYRAAMIDSGFIMPEFDDDSEEEEGTDKPSGDEAPKLVEKKQVEKKESKPVATEKAEKSSTTEKKQEKPDEEGEEEDGEDDMQILPQITNESAVFEALIEIVNAKLANVKDNDPSEINWEKAGVIRKPSLVAGYLKEVEKDILIKVLLECEKQRKNVSKPTPSTSDKKRKISDTELPKAKKNKKN